MFDFLRKREACSCARAYGCETRICEHLMDGAALGWFFRRAPETLDASWPDAWCAACQRAVEGGATPAFTTVCDGCYERRRERNWPADTTGKLASLLDRARPELITRQEALATRHDLDQYDTYHWGDDDAPARLLLSTRSTGRAVALDVVHVGSHSTRSGTWLWSWGHGELSEVTKAPVRAVRAYGEAHHVLKLATPHWPAKPPDAWDMVAVASHFIPCRGTYRLPHENGHDYFLVREVAPHGA